MDKDKFLQKKQIQLYDSQFLKDFYQNKQVLNRQAYDPMDKHGKRLSQFWEQGDTILTVILKRMKFNARYILNPDTYSHQNIKQLKKQAYKQKIRLIMVAAIIFIPISIIMPYLAPKFKRIKREFIFQYYLQAKVLSRSLQTGTRQVPKDQMEKIIKQINEKISM